MRRTGPNLDEGCITEVSKITGNTGNEKHQNKCVVSVCIYRWMQKLYADRERTNRNKDSGIVRFTCQGSSAAG